MTDNLDSSIKTNAKGPKRARGDAGEMEQHSLRDQIAPDKHLESKKASRAKGLGIRLAKLPPEGTV